jgi:cytochrome c-type biogenesis protein
MFKFIEVRRRTDMSFTFLGLLAAFGAGVLSFLAPCVLPLVPSYLSYLAGTSLEDARVQSSIRWRVSLHALWFVLGFALLFTVLGAVTALVGVTLSAYQLVLDRIGGVLLILFGIALTGWIPLPWLSGSYYLQVKPGRSIWWRSGLIGIAFGASWSACTGPILGAILVLTAGSSRGVLQGAIVMLTFALGLGVPFLLVGFLVDRASLFLRRIRRFTALFSTIGGVILILLGILLLTGLFSNYG